MSSCRPTRGRFRNLTRIVRDYLETRGTCTASDLRFYRDQPTQRDAIIKAAMAEKPNGKRASHQRRIPQAVLRKATDALLAADVGKCRTFHELYVLVQRTAGDFHGFGRLTVYDTAHRLGAYLGLSPEHVYVHAGVRDGLRALGLNHRVARISVSELPSTFHRLRPDQAEDCLCIYKAHFRALSPI